MSYNPYFDGPLQDSCKIKYNNISSITIVTDVTSEPVSLSEAKAHLYVDFTDQDTNITRLISVAREQIEDEVKLALAPKTIKVGIRNELGNFKLPYWVEGTFTSLKEDDGTTLIAASSYEIVDGVLKTSFSEIVFAEYVTGYATCPAKYKQRILERLAFLYNNRGDQTKTTSGQWLL